MGNSNPEPATISYRKDIDGLRAFAVSAVVLYHALPGLAPSGFVGVDVFFVISGFLIGGIIFNLARDGRFSFADFYARRARRILPALVALITFVSLLVPVFFGRKETLEYAGQAAMALLGISNFYFWEHSNYFDTASELEPLLMTWSLGVEEQFYVIFPFFVFFLARLGRSLRLVVLSAIIVISFGVSLRITALDPISAFYLLPARAWELGIGAALAIARADGVRILPKSRWIPEALGAVAAAGLIVSFFVYDHSTPFPGAAALLPVLATAGLIVARESAFNRHVLSAMPLVAIGKISYSWYLWHWPLMALVRRASDYPPPPSTMLLVAGLSLVIGALSWRFVEQPFRHAQHPPRATLLRYAVVLVAAAALPVLFKVTGGLPQRLPHDVLVAEDTKEQGRGSCLVDTGSAALLDRPRCVPANAAIALIGDSHASAYGPGLVASARDHGLKVATFTKSSCPPLPGVARFDPKRPAHGRECAAFNAAVLQRILDTPSIQTVFVAAFWDADWTLGEIPADASGQEAAQRQDVLEPLRKLRDDLGRAGKRMILVGDVPALKFDPLGHIIGEALPLRRAIGTYSDGGKRVTGTTFEASDRFAVTQRIIASIAEEIDVDFVDPSRQLCTGSTCDFVSNAKPIYFDKHHLSAYGSGKIDWKDSFTPTDRRRARTTVDRRG